MGIFDMEAGTIIFLGILFWAATIAIFYYIIKLAVRNGNIEAQGRVAGAPRMRSTPNRTAGAPRFSDEAQSDDALMKKYREKQEKLAVKHNIQKP